MSLFGQSTSISVFDSSGGDILIHNDDKFRGSDNCKDCRFNPCKVKIWFKKKNIEDCKLWNKINPDTLGEIIDYR